MSWFNRKDKNISSEENKKDIPKGLWVKCPSCSEIQYKPELEKNFSACLGALKIIKDGWETEAIPKVSDQYIKKKGFFDKLFGIH